ncbi:MAG: hypothetical protein QXE01_12305 [Sulfolobales archaeon]
MENSRKFLENHLKIRYKRVEIQVESLRDYVDKSIAYISLSYGVKGEKIKVITVDGRLREILSAKINELGIDNVIIKFVEPEDISAQRLINLVGDP